ncbi:MAG: thioredoxin-disulfide reductase [Candidatus Bostrichicola ureolyticus]|nr:MAG: thioredoxin-disulfide reductase [Candidatus Bostrichicola ureolyticus]
MLKTIAKCVIIGSGPAGYSAAIYAARADLNPIIYTGLEPGGQLTQTTIIDNYPGYPIGITGFELMENFKKQAERFGTIIIHDKISKVFISNEKSGIHTIQFSNKTLQSKGLIIATGASSKYLGLKNEKRLLGYGVSTCATCDGFFFKEKYVAVIGGGDTAIEEAIYLSKMCKYIYIFVRNNILKASKAMQRNVSYIKNIEIFFNHEVKDILGEKEVEGIKVINKENKNEKIFYVKGIFIAIGHIPNTELFKGQLKMDENNYIITKKGTTLTSKPGVFAAGDVQDPRYRQAITSAGTGCMAALDLEKYLINKFYYYK